MKDTKKITVDGKKVEIKKIPVRKFAELLMAIENLPGKIQGMFTQEELNNVTNEMMITKIPLMLAEAQEELFSLVAIASGIDIEKIEELSLEEFVDVISAVLELNNFSAIVTKVKNMMGILQKK